VFNDTPTLKGEHKKTPRELFTRTRISAKVRHHHAFGCLVYVLAAPLQSGKKSLSAWMSHAWVGINLYISPTHTCSVALVLSLKITTTGASKQRRRTKAVTAAPALQTGATTQSGRTVQLTQKARENKLQGNKWVAWIANTLKPPKLLPRDEVYTKLLAVAEYDIQDRTAAPIVFSTTSNPNTIDWNQAMQQPDKKQLL
jgi:hypothetical protein